MKIPTVNSLQHLVQFGKLSVVERTTILLEIHRPLLKNEISKILMRVDLDIVRWTIAQI